MSTVPTAKEFYDAHYSDDAVVIMRDFAKLHVEAAIKNAYDCGTFKGWTNSSDENVHKELFVKNIMSRQSIK